jgi:hypothetical protein
VTNGPKLKDTSGTCIWKYFKSSPTNWISSEWTEKDEQNALEGLKNKSWKHPTVPSSLASSDISYSLAPSGIRSSGTITKKPDLLVACASPPKTATPAAPTLASTAKRIGGHGQAEGKRKAGSKEGRAGLALVLKSTALTELAWTCNWAAQSRAVSTAAIYLCEGRTVRRMQACKLIMFHYACTHVRSGVWSGSAANKAYLEKGPRLGHPSVRVPECIKFRQLLVPRLALAWGTLIITWRLLRP